MHKAARTHLIMERKQRLWSQQEVADRLGTTRPNVSRWEAGLTTPGPYFRAKLCELFGKTAQELGLVKLNLPSQPTSETEASSVDNIVSVSADTPSLWNVPYPRNPRFTGRDNLLQRLEQQFFQQERLDLRLPRHAARTQPQALNGLGGIGKTQIAVEYAYRAYEQGRYIHVFWVNAANEEAILGSFVALANLFPNFAASEEADQHKLVKAVKGWLEQCPQPWLLIFDNADEVSLLQPYLPQRGNGSLLLTTRSHAVGALATSIEVETMGLVEGTTLLLQRTQRQDARENELDEATNIVVALDGFPLALDQAGAYIEETGCSFADYLQTYQQHRRTLLARRGTQTTNYPDSVATTWSLSFQRITERNPATAELLRLCAFLAPDAIPEELLIQSAAFWPAVLQQATMDRLIFNQTLEELLRFSLIKRLAEKRSFSLHRLVQVVQRDALSSEEQHQWAERVVRAVHAVFPGNPKGDVSCWPQCLHYLEQAQACNALIQEYQLLLPEAAELLDRAGTYLSEHASFSLAEPLFQRALSIREVQAALPLTNLAELYLKQGKYEQAGSSYQRAIAIYEQHLGSEHPALADPLNGLGSISYYQGKYELVEPLYQRALSIREQHLGPAHPLIARMLSNLALFYTKQGRFVEAEPLFQRALRIQEQQLGEMHPDLATVLNALADLYREQRRFAEAEPLFQRSLAIREQQLGKAHPDLAYPLNGLAQVYYTQEKYVEAEPLFQQALALWEQQMGPEHSLVAYPLAGLGKLYTRQGKYEQAERSYQRALAIWEQQLGTEHSLVAYPLAGLAELYTKQGKFARAEPLFQRALFIHEHTPGEQPLVIAETLDTFAAFLEAQSRYQEAVTVYQRTLAIREQVLGAEHSQTIQAREQLHVLERMREKHNGAQLKDAETTGAEQSGELRNILPSCPHCQSASAVVKSGTNQSGSLRFRCRHCQRYFTPQVTSRGYEETWKEQAVFLAEQGKSYRFIARQLGVNHRTIRTWLTVEKEGFPNTHPALRKI